MNNFIELINFFKEKKNLDCEFVQKFIDFLSNSQSSEIELAALTAAWKIKGENADELALIAQNILSKLSEIEIENPIVDCCGTGGDGLNTFNISTTSAFLAAAFGIKVAKHGGRKTTSISGSIDFIEALKIPCFSEPEEIKKQIAKNGIVFIASPALHSILGKWKTVCRKLGFSGQTGLIGTLTNPVKITHQIIGVPKPEWGFLMAEALKLLGRQKAIIVHGFPCLDEASLCGLNQIWFLQNGQITHSTIDPYDLGLRKTYMIEELKGGLPEENVQIFHSILQNKASEALINTVCLNTGLILWLCEYSKNLKEGFEKTQKLISSGDALVFWQNLKFENA